MRNLVLIITPSNFGKHLIGTSQVKIVIIQENKMLLEKDKILSKQKDVVSVFNKHFRSITDCLDRIPSTGLKLLNLNQDRPSKKLVFLVKSVQNLSYDNFSHKSAKLNQIWSHDHSYYII